jgi:hypothetical protein
MFTDPVRTRIGWTKEAAAMLWLMFVVAIGGGGSFGRQERRV